MRQIAAVTVLALVVAACGGTDATSSSTTLATTTVAPATTSGAEPTTTATTQPPPTTSTTTQSPSPSDPPALDRSILSLALADGDTRPGRFKLLRGRNTETLMTVDGRYWALGDGNVYTALEVDPELIAAEMEKLVETFEAVGGQPPDSPSIISLRDHYRGNEFQIGLTDLVRSLALGGLPAEWAEQWSWFIQADGSPVPAELTACRDAITALDLAARTWIAGLDIKFSEGQWVFPVAEFEESLAAEIEEASICELFIDAGGASPEIVFELSSELDRYQLDVLVDDKLYTDREPEVMFSILMTPDESIGSPPDPNPASLLTLRGSYLAAIGVCGELPWIYSNFAAGDNYYSPNSDGYSGPTVFASGWYCEDDVPESRRDNQ